jgi:hypothetical protein
MWSEYRHNQHFALTAAELRSVVYAHVDGKADFIKWFPSGRTVAFASIDGMPRIYIYVQHCESCNGG